MALEAAIRSSIATGGHDHLLVRAALLELTALHGSRWVKASSSYDWEERHKRAASFYLRKAAETAAKYQFLRSNVQEIGSGDPIPMEELEDAVPPSVLRHIVEQQCLRKESDQGGLDDETDSGGVAVANDDTAASNASGSRPGSAAESDAAAMAYRPEPYVSPRQGESQKDADELSSCEISMRSILYYYLELLQQRRICEAAVNSDARAQSIVDIHKYLLEKAPSYVEHCCFSEAPVFKERVPNESGELEEDGSEPSMEFVSCLVISLCFFFFSISNPTPHLSSNPLSPARFHKFNPFQVSASTIIFQWYTPDRDNSSSTAEQRIDGYVLLGKGQASEDEEADNAEPGSYGTLAKVTLDVSAARELCAMFSSARNGLEKAAAAEAAGVSSDLVADENIEVRGKLARALSRASRLLCPAALQQMLLQKSRHLPRRPPSVCCHSLKMKRTRRLKRPCKRTDLH